MQVELWYAANIADRDPLAMRAKLATIDVEAADDLVLLERTFAMFNRGSGREHPALDANEMRSLSVGDVVGLRDERGPRFYYCDSMGWQAVERP